MDSHDTFQATKNSQNERNRSKNYRYGRRICLPDIPAQTLSGHSTKTTSSNQKSCVSLPQINSSQSTITSQHSFGRKEVSFTRPSERNINVYDRNTNEKCVPRPPDHNRPHEKILPKFNHPGRLINRQSSRNSVRMTKSNVNDASMAGMIPHPPERKRFEKDIAPSPLNRRDSSGIGIAPPPSDSQEELSSRTQLHRSQKQKRHKTTKKGIDYVNTTVYDLADIKECSKNLPIIKEFPRLSSPEFTDGLPQRKPRKMITPSIDIKLQPIKVHLSHRKGGKNTTNQ